MIKINPFKAIRPTRDKAYLVASRSYLSYSETTLREKLLNNPYTFLHVINPEYSLDAPILHGIEKYKLVRQKYLNFRSDGTLVKDEKPCFYIYQQVTQENIYTGIIVAASIDDYLNGSIKVHENTISKREAMFSDYLEYTGFNAEPVLLTYRKIPRVNQIMNVYMQERPEYEFTSTNKVLHNLWLIDKDIDIKEIQSLFMKVDSVYIADGHHRSASSALYCYRKRKQLTKIKGSEPFNYFMSFMIDYEQMRIYDFNRLVKDLNGLSIDEYLLKVGEVYNIEKKVNDKPIQKDEIYMYLDGNWFSLIAKAHTYDASHCVDHLDPAILSKNILYPILGIKDIRNDQRIDFMDGKQGLTSLKNAVDSGDYRVAFALKPITIEQLTHVSDQNQVMPPKSTYIEPKLRSGLTIYSLGEE
tara:strand:- start:12 stop:1253 length:1242 start_codon:yes stop_codon:yes gene_type:complete